MNGSNQMLPSPNQQSMPHNATLRLHNVNGQNPASTNYNNTFQMLREAQNNLTANPKNQMVPSGSSIKLNARHSVNGYHEGTTLKQKVFSLPKEVNGVTQITSMTRADGAPIIGENGGLVTEHGANSLSPLLPGQAIPQPGKRHTSVEPSLNPNIKVA